jgi:hypothetical protein
MGLRAYGVAVLTATAALWLMSVPRSEHALWPDPSPESVRTLESAVATERSDTAKTTALALAYLDARQPGLAVALVEAAPAAAQKDVRVQHVYARALIDQGRNDEALAVERDVVGACRSVAEATQTPAAPAGCDSVLLASAVRRTSILGELISLGVTDAQAHPEQARIAYRNATREARVMVQ